MIRSHCGGVKIEVMDVRVYATVSGSSMCVRIYIVISLTKAAHRALTRFNFIVHPLFYRRCFQFFSTPFIKCSFYLK